MPRHLWSGTACFVGLFATVLIGQTTQTPPSSSTVSVVGCLQRNDNSGTLDATIPEETATPETAPALANSNEPAPGFQLAAATPLRAAPDPKALTVYALEGSDS